MAVLNYILTRVYINKYTYFSIIFWTFTNIYFEHGKHASGTTNCDQMLPQTWEVSFLALHFGTQLRYRITNVLLLMDSLVVYCKIINYKHDP